MPRPTAVAKISGGNVATGDFNMPKKQKPVYTADEKNALAALEEAEKEAASIAPKKESVIKEMEKHKDRIGALLEKGMSRKRITEIMKAHGVILPGGWLAKLFPLPKKHSAKKAAKKSAKKSDKSSDESNA